MGAEGIAVGEPVTRTKGWEEAIKPEKKGVSHDARCLPTGLLLAAFVITYNYLQVPGVSCSFLQRR